MTLEPDKTKEGMDYLYHIGNAILNSYLDIGEFKKNPEKNWEFFHTSRRSHSILLHQKTT